MNRLACLLRSPAVAVAVLLASPMGAANAGAQECVTCWTNKCPGMKSYLKACAAKGAATRGGKAAKGAAPGAPVEAPPPPAPIAAACAVGQTKVAGHCCWPGQDWGAATGKCVGTPQCPAGMKGEPTGGCSCEAGRQVVSGHCCWPGQDWGTTSNKCVGEAQCPAGSAKMGEGCFSLEAFVGTWDFMGKGGGHFTSTVDKIVQTSDYSINRVKIRVENGQLVVNQELEWTLVTDLRDGTYHSRTESRLHSTDTDFTSTDSSDSTDYEGQSTHSTSSSHATTARQSLRVIPELRAFEIVTRSHSVPNEGAPTDSVGASMYVLSEDGKELVVFYKSIDPPWDPRNGPTPPYPTSAGDLEANLSRQRATHLRDALVIATRAENH